MKNFLKISQLLLLALLATAVLFVATGWNPVACAGIVFFIGSFIPMPTGTVNGVLVETWANYLIERFWKDNQFLRNAYDDSQYVQMGRKVYIPQPGTKPSVEKDRTVFPGTAAKRTDSTVDYTLSSFTTDPTHIPNIDSIHLSYDKQDSVLGDHMETLNERIADEMLLLWGANATFVLTTGGPDAVAISPITGQTGDRKGFHHTDLQALMIRMNVDNVPKAERYCMIDDNMFSYFYESLGENKQRDFSKMVDPATGVVGMIHNFKILTRSSVLNATDASAVKAYGAALSATDHLCSFAWQKNSIAFAIGDTKLFEEKNSPLYYGDVYSAEVLAGGRVRRTDGKGVYIIRQANG
jgi:hypothetical protein